VVWVAATERSRVAAIPLFADLPDDELAAVAGVASEVEVPSGQALTAEVVIEGATVRTVGAGDVIGEIAVLASPPDRFAAPEVVEGRDFLTVGAYKLSEGLPHSGLPPPPREVGRRTTPPAWP
jgi:hypothetical protein